MKAKIYMELLEKMESLVLERRSEELSTKLIIAWKLLPGSSNLRSMTPVKLISATLGP
jgi:hypothetical protein